MSSVIVAIMFLASWLGMTDSPDSPWVCEYHPPAWVDQVGVVHTQEEAYMCLDTERNLLVWGDRDGVEITITMG